MNDHPINLGVRFLLEVVAVAAIGVWGWHQGNAATKYLLAIGLPLMAMAVWGVFRVPGDPGHAPVAVNGVVRLIIETLFFGAGTAALFLLGYRTQGWMFLSILLVHYAVSYDRVMRLMQL